MKAGDRLFVYVPKSEYLIYISEAEGLSVSMYIKSKLRNDLIHEMAEKGSKFTNRGHIEISAHENVNFNITSVKENSGTNKDLLYLENNEKQNVIDSKYKVTDSIAPFYVEAVCLGMVNNDCLF